MNPRAIRHGLKIALGLLALLLIALLVYGAVRGRAQDLPWAPLDLGEPPGLFTTRKIAALGDDPAACRALLDRAGVTYETLPAVQPREECGYSDGLRLDASGSRRIGFAPNRPPVACPIAASLAMWEWNVLQRAARRHFGTRVRTIVHLGTYQCRRLYGRDTGAWSRHATADAIDVAGFELADGTRISVLGDWAEEGAKSAFLREVRDGACGVFGTVLSPDYNAAHRDHLHLDIGGWKACR